ncbi:MAG: M20/M25/M40 family metallo-hydrolase [Bacteroidia bacterium]|nr:M20/M25/M40 family metallo-hydrolase [Bacteroidia bacterium]
MKPILITAFSLAGSLFSMGQVPQNPLLPATWNIKSEELLGYVVELAGDQYQGRLTGSGGYRKAAEWMAGKLAEWGVQPGFREKGWFQDFPQPYVTVFPGCSLTLHLPVNGTDSINIPYRYFDEYMPGSTSGSGTVRAEVIFAGYGISAPELGYDDYSGISVKGKIVLLRPEAPLSPASGAEKFTPWQPYSTHQYKMLNAIKHGAVGILYHYGPLANTNNDYHQELQVTMVGNRVVEDLFKGTGNVYGELVSKISSELKPRSFATGKVVSIKNVTEFHPDGVGMNVIGLIPGSDPLLKDEVIIIGGHLDHCGMDWEICPGANDNASGIAVILGVAKALATSGMHFKRSIMFVGIGAEEQGLIGSKAYVANPVFPVSRTIGFINLDCVGIGPNLHAGGGQNYPDLYNAINQANANYVHRNLSTSFSTNLGRPRSDAAIFMQAGIPTVSFSSSGGSGAYHTPDDKPSTIWPETLEDLATILTLAIADLALISGK